MPITTDTTVSNLHRKTGNATSGNEVIIKVDPRFSTALDAYMASAGVAQVFISVDPSYDAATNGFTEMTPDDTGAQSANFNRVVEPGATWIGLKITSGIWNLKVMQRKEAFVG